MLHLYYSTYNYTLLYREQFARNAILCVILQCRLVSWTFTAEKKAAEKELFGYIYILATIPRPTSCVATRPLSNLRMGIQLDICG